MKLFECQNCGQLIYFENTLCERCGFALGFLPDTAMMTALQPDGSGAFTPLADRSRTVSYCANFTHGACNWLINSGCGPLCQACELNRTIPDLTQPENLRLWQQIEIAKRRLVYSLLRLGLPILSKTEAPHAGIAFNFLAPPPGENGQGKILTGHDNGEITLNVAEADDALRAKIQQKMHEPYRTLLGHFRHEAAHYYWDRLVKDKPAYRLFRQAFGDETQDYSRALQAHYANGAPPGWRTGTSAPTPAPIRMKIGPRRSRIICTWWTRWRRPMLSGSGSGRAPGRTAISRPASPSTLTPRPTSKPSSRPGCR